MINIIKAMNNLSTVLDSIFLLIVRPQIPPAIPPTTIKAKMPNWNSGTLFVIKDESKLATWEKKIIYVGETKNEERYTGYLATLHKHNIPIRNDFISHVILSTEGGYRGTKALLNRTQDMTAILCPNDLTAIGAMRALQEAGFKIPSDMSVISIDDIDMAQYLSPMLTTIHVPLDEMGQTAAKILIDRIQGGHHLPMKISLPFYLAIRESCAAPRKTKDMT